MQVRDSFGARASLSVGDRAYEVFRLDALSRAGLPVERLPYALRVLLENLLRHEDGVNVTADDIRALCAWDPAAEPAREISFSPARVLLQDFTGVPAVVDLAAMRDAMVARGGDPSSIDPAIPVELVVDHSIQVDAFGVPDAITINRRLDYSRNQERYTFLKWAERAFQRFVVLPPNMGICHQVNLEHLARVVFSADELRQPARGAMPQAYPDSVLGTDSHTPMVNGLGVLGWGVGGIEAEAAMLGQRISLLIPQVVGFKLVGARAPGVTATDLVLRVTEMLRARGVVGSFVEFFGPGLSDLSLPDRATIANMSPEFGATCSMFPVDRMTLDYLRVTGRSAARIALVESYMKAQGLFHTPDTSAPRVTDTLELDLGSVEPSIAGPGRPQDRIALANSARMFASALPDLLPPRATPQAPDPAVAGASAPAEPPSVSCEIDGQRCELSHGSVVIAAITSCTNTSNPAVMLAAGLLARNAVERGLRRRPWVKTSLAPGSKVVTAYYERCGLSEPLRALGFELVGYGCTTCIGNSGPLLEEVSDAIARAGLVTAAVLSGNRNFEGRIHAEVRANYLMSPPLVIAFALAGRIDIDMSSEPLGEDGQGRPVYLADLWPSADQLQRALAQATDPALFQATYRDLFAGDDAWHALEPAGGTRYAWRKDSSYVRRPPYLDAGFSPIAPSEDVSAARVLLWLGDGVTTDHISPAGFIAPSSPAGRYLQALGIAPDEFNSYGARRGNHEVMVRGTFANSRIRNRLIPGSEGPITLHLPTRERLAVYDAAMRYRAERTPLLVIAGREYGTGSSRDWAAKGPHLLGVRAILAQSYERIHRSNLVGMGVLPLQFEAGERAESFGLTGEETFDIEGIAASLSPQRGAPRQVVVTARGERGSVRFRARVRIDTPQEAASYQHGGILQHALANLAKGVATAAGDMELASPAALPLRRGNDDSKTADSALVEQASEQSFPASDPPAF